jgi:hypothetical protein
MSADFETCGIYVEIDALLDTRLAALYRLDKTKIIDEIASGYLTRVSDEFVHYDQKAFEELYQNRGKEQLITDAILTEAWRFINFFSVQTLHALVSSPLQRQPKLYLNVYPYKLSETVISAMITALANLLKNQIDIEVIEATKEEITPKHAKKHFAFMVIYDYWNWLDIHSANQNLKDTQLSEVTMIVPALLKSRAAAKELAGIDAFGAIEQLTAPFVKTQIYPVSKFCPDINRIAELGKENA